MEIKQEIKGVTDAKLLNQANRDKRYPTHTKRIELDHYTPTEMEQYLFFQNYGKGTADNVLC
ncbi:hypothetical protein [Yersinia phage vB_YenM_P778]